MSARVAEAMRRRRLVLVVAAIGCSLLIVLPLIGLSRINSKVEKSHDYVLLVSDVNDLASDLIRMTTLELAIYGSQPSDDTEGAARARLAEARTNLAGIESRLALAAELDLAEVVEGQLEIMHRYLDAADDYMVEISEGSTIEESPSAQLVIAAATELVQNESTLATSLPPVSANLSQERKDAVNQAMALLGVAAGIGILTLGALAFIDSRRVERVLSDESGRREHAERVAAHRADVVSMASHELRNPLTILMMTTDILDDAARKLGNQEIGALTSDARVAAIRCNLLVDELLDLGRLDAERLQLRIGATPLLPALRSAIEVSISQHGPREVEISGDAASHVSADPDRLKTILRNLIDNAFKYSPQDSTVRVHISEENSRVRLDVLDEGGGVASEYRELIFERYHRAPATAHVSGIGIGLFLSRELARRMNGELCCIESERGSDFRLELPGATPATA